MEAKGLSSPELPPTNTLTLSNTNTVPFAVVVYNIAAPETQFPATTHERDVLIEAKTQVRPHRSSISLRNPHNQFLWIATDTEEDQHKLILADWSFLRPTPDKTVRARLAVKQTSERTKIFLKGLHHSLEKDDIVEILEKHQIAVSRAPRAIVCFNNIPNRNFNACITLASHADRQRALQLHRITCNLTHLVFHAVDYVSQPKHLKSCFHCNGASHIAAECPLVAAQRPSLCRNCGEDRSPSHQCERTRCSNCNQPHVAKTGSCPVLSELNTKRKSFLDTASRKRKAEAHKVATKHRHDSGARPVADHAQPVDSNRYKEFLMRRFDAIASAIASLKSTLTDLERHIRAPAKKLVSFQGLAKRPSVAKSAPKHAGEEKTSLTPATSPPPPSSSTSNPSPAKPQTKRISQILRRPPSSLQPPHSSASAQRSSSSLPSSSSARSAARPSYLSATRSSALRSQHRKRL